MHMLITNEYVSREVRTQRKRLGQDRKDEVWDGVYVVMPETSPAHQLLLAEILNALREIVNGGGLGVTMPGTNVSDRPKNWKKNFRVPDAIVLLNDTRVVTKDAYLYGGPEFLVEIQSPGDETDRKVPFYAKLGVRELLIVGRDTRAVQLLSNNGGELLHVEPDADGWLASQVLPLAVRKVVRGKKPFTEIRRTDGKPGRWTF